MFLVFFSHLFLLSSAVGPMLTSVYSDAHNPSICHFLVHQISQSMMNLWDVEMIVLTCSFASCSRLQQLRVRLSLISILRTRLSRPYRRYHARYQTRSLECCFLCYDTKCVRQLHSQNDLAGNQRFPVQLGTPPSPLAHTDSWKGWDSKTHGERNQRGIPQRPLDMN